MLRSFKPWRFIAALVIGFSIGFFSGVYVYATILDKPEIVNQNSVKQKIKIKGRGNNTLQDYEAIDERETHKKRRQNGR
ncbi:MAG: hypothetical protein PF489_05460 [Salinivirgaceae bacterium]|jgi:hypothetical protein|nr:hypothetical protein [Salinivirgaceae bacterium]